MRDKVPPKVFTTPYFNPAGGNPQAVRDNLREAVHLFKEAGYEVRDGKVWRIREYMDTRGGWAQVFDEGEPVQLIEFIDE